MDSSHEWQVTEVANDLRVAGELRLRLSSRHDSSSFSFVATDRVAESTGRDVRVEFRQADTSVIIRQTSDAEPDISHAEQQEAWQSILNGF